MMPLNRAANFLESLIDRAKATARVMGSGSPLKPDSSCPRLASPFQQPTILATSSRRSSDFSSAICAWKVPRPFQAPMADDNSELRLDDVAKIVGCWNGLAKRGQLESGFSGDPEPMTRAVAFARSIKDSKKFAALF